MHKRHAAFGTCAKQHAAWAISISDQNFGSKVGSQALNICTACFAGAPVEVTEHGKILDVMPTQIGMMTSELVLFYASSGLRHMICEQRGLIAHLSRHWVGFQSEKAHWARKNLHNAQKVA